MSSAAAQKIQGQSAKTPTKLNRTSTPLSTSKSAQQGQREEPSTPTAARSTPQKTVSSSKKATTTVKKQDSPTQSQDLKSEFPDASKSKQDSQNQTASASEKLGAKAMGQDLGSKATNAGNRARDISSNAKAGTTTQADGPAKTPIPKKLKSTAAKSTSQSTPDKMAEVSKDIDRDAASSGIHPAADSTEQIDTGAADTATGDDNNQEHDDDDVPGSEDELQPVEPEPMPNDDGHVTDTSAGAANDAKSEADDAAEDATDKSATDALQEPLPETTEKQSESKQSSRRGLLNGARSLAGKAAKIAGKASKNGKNVDPSEGQAGEATDAVQDAANGETEQTNEAIDTDKQRRRDSAPDEHENTSDASDKPEDELETHKETKLQNNDDVVPHNEKQDTNDEAVSTDDHDEQPASDDDPEQGVDDAQWQDICAEDLPLDYTILKGLEVQADGQVFSQEGEPIAHLAEGDAEDLNGYPIGDDAEILDEDGDLVGRIEFLPTEIKRQLQKAKDEGTELPTAAERYLTQLSGDDGDDDNNDDEDEPALPSIKILEGLKCGLDGLVYDDDGNTVGVVTEGDPDQLQDAKLNDDGEFVNAEGEVVGRARIHEEAAQLVEQGIYNAADDDNNEPQEDEKDNLDDKVADVTEDTAAGAEPEGIEDELPGIEALKGKELNELGVVDDQGEILAHVEDENLKEKIESGEIDPQTLHIDESGQVVDEDNNVLSGTQLVEGAAKKLAGIAPSYDIRILEGRKVNKKAKVLDDDGEEIGQLVEGDAATCTGKRINAKGQVLGPDDRIIGKVKVSEGEAAQDATRQLLEELEQDDQDDLPALDILEGLKVNRKSMILDENGEPIGKLVDGDLSECTGKKCNDKGEVLSKKGDVIGRAITLPTSAEDDDEAQDDGGTTEEPAPDDEDETQAQDENEPDVAAEEEDQDSDLPPLSTLEGYAVNKSGKVLDNKNNIIGELFEGDAKKLSKLKATCDAEGRFWDNKGRVIGRAKTVPTEDAEEEAQFAGLDSLKVTEGGWVVDGQGNRVGQVVEGDAKKLVGRSVDEDGDIIDKRSSVVGHAERYSEEEVQEEEAEPEDLSFLQGKSVNKAGLVMHDGIPVARVVQRRVKELAGRKLGADGQVYNDSGTVIGRVELIPEEERDGRPDGPFAGLEDLRVIKDGKVVDGNDNVVGMIADGNAKRLVGLTVDEDGDIIDRHGNVKGRAEPWQEPEEEAAPEEDLSALDKTTINKAGNAVDSSGAVVGRVVEGDVKKLVVRKVDGKGQIWDNSGHVIGRCELAVGDDNAADGPFAGFEGLQVQKDGLVKTSAGDTVGKVIEGDVKKLVGRPVDEDGDIVSKNGNRIGKAERWEPEEKERRKNPMSGLRVNREGEVRDQNGDLIGRLTDGNLGHCVGQEIDDNANVVDQDGNKIGEVTLLENIVEEEYEAPSEEELAEARKRDEEREIAKKMADICQQTLDRVQPLCKQISDYLETADRTPRDELDEEALVDKVKPLIEEAGRYLQECNGSLRGLDPDGHIAAQAKGRAGTAEATPEEVRLAETLKELTSTVVTCIDSAKKKLNDMPHAKKKLNPLWALLTQPLFQILAAVGLLLAGVLGLVGQLLNGLGLGGLVNGLLGGLGIDKLLQSIGLGGGGKKKGEKSGGGVSDLPIIGGLLGGK